MLLFPTTVTTFETLGVCHSYMLIEMTVYRVTIDPRIRLQLNACEIVYLRQFQRQYATVVRPGDDELCPRGVTKP